MKSPKAGLDPESFAPRTYASVSTSNARPATEIEPPNTCLRKYAPPSAARDNAIENGMAAQSNSVTLVSEVYWNALTMK